MTEETDLQSKVETNGKESKAVGGVAIKKILLILAAAFRNLDLQPSAARDGSLLPRPLMHTSKYVSDVCAESWLTPRRSTSHDWPWQGCTRVPRLLPGVRVNQLGNFSKKELIPNLRS